VGEGRISYLGAWLESDLMRRVMEWAVQASGVSRHFPRPPERVEVCRRVGAGKELFVVINHGPQAERLMLPRPMKDVLCGSEAKEHFTLPAYGVAVLADS
jgi:beta-galactosidase